MFTFQIFFLSALTLLSLNNTFEVHEFFWFFYHYSWSREPDIKSLEPTQKSARFLNNESSPTSWCGKMRSGQYWWQVIEPKQQRRKLFFLILNLKKSNVKNNRCYLLAGMDHVDAEGVHGIPTNIIPGDRTQILLTHVQ